MSKIFRLHSGASQNIEGWQETAGHLSDNFISTIPDPAGATAHTQITSIPSPFARMDLVRTAFRYINSKKDLDGTTIYHKMVSECLDVAQIFFNIEALEDKIELIEWHSGIIENGGELDVDANSDLGRLLYAQSAKHRLLGETLKMFLFQDSKAFNFSELKNIYLLNYKQGPELINIIGGTSPATLFFSSANDLSYVDIAFGNDTVFDSSFCPLFKRNAEFIKFLYGFRNAFPGFAEKFPDIEQYLDLTFLYLEDSLKEAIRKLEPEAYHTAYNATTVNAEGNNAEILGFKLKCKKYNQRPNEEDYDFVIEATSGIHEVLPLALPKEPFNEPLRYAGGVWQKNYHQSVPFMDARPLQERTLPNQAHIKYPFLTVSDLLEPYLIRLPFPMDDQKYFNGNYEVRQGENDHCFALPIKKKFFEYFSISDLKGTVSDGKKFFELVQMPGGVRATLRIPIRGGRYINYSRMYSLNLLQDRVQKADEADNMGVIVENQFTVGIYPFLRLNQEVNPHYRIMFVDRDVQPSNKHFDYTLNFYTEANPSNSLTLHPPKVRSRKDQAQGVTSKYYVLESNFDFFEVSHNLATGLVIPTFEPLPTPSKTFKFAIDFGTTNTHIEYKIGTDGKAHPFDIAESDVQLGTLHLANEKTEEILSNPKFGFGATKLLDIIKVEFMPYLISKDTQYKFPQRTVINDNDAFVPDEANFALADFNIPFWYLKENLRLNSEITPNLKWADFKSKKLERRTRAFLKQLMLMIRNKVILNGGDLEATEIVWFYPSSMPVFRRKFLQANWTEYYKRYFGGVDKLNKMSESLAPFHYFKNHSGINAMDKPVVCVDIGGGTSDVVIYTNNEPSVLTSFKFASNSLFGDGYGNSSATNGFVLKYEKQIRESLSNTVAKNLTDVYESLKSKNSKSLELIEFFFSLEDNKQIKDNRIPLAFSKMLASDTDLKVVFLFYYGAIIYHIANLMKAKKLVPPRYLTFSGNGSKVIHITAGSTDLENLTLFTKVVFADVFQLEKLPALELKLYENPKEITCKGGLECQEYKRYDSIESEIRNVLVGSQQTRLVPEQPLTYLQIKDPALVDSVCSEVNRYIDHFFGWNAKISYYQYFGISPSGFERYKEYLKEDIRAYLLIGIEEKLSEAQDDADINIEETLFFYPLVGAINKLAYKVQCESN